MPLLKYFFLCLFETFMSNQIACEIQTFLDGLIKKYNERLSAEFSIEKKVLDELWNNCVSNAPSSSPKNPFDIVKPTVHLTTKMTTCEYIFAKGEKHGERCKSATMEGEKFCSVHNYHTSPTPPQEDQVPSTSITNSGGPKIPGFFKNQNTSLTMDLIEPVQDSFFRVRLSKDFNRFFCLTTGFVLKSEEEFSVIIGKRNGTKIDRLSKSDIEKVLKMSMTYEPLLPEWKQDMILNEEVDFSLIDPNDLPEIASLSLAKVDNSTLSYSTKKVKFSETSASISDLSATKKVKYSETTAPLSELSTTSSPCFSPLEKKVDKKRALEIAEEEDEDNLSPTLKKRSRNDDDQETDNADDDQIVFDIDSEIDDGV